MTQATYNLKHARAVADTLTTHALAQYALADFERYQTWVVSHLGCKFPEAACAIGLPAEAGEAADCIKKHLCHELPLDRDKLVKELGDTLFYLAGMAALNGISLDEIKATNIRKLEARYPNGFSTAAAAARADEQAQPNLPPVGNVFYRNSGGSESGIPGGAE